MKKALSFLLAAIMLLATTTTAFAVNMPKITGMAQSLSAGYTSDLGNDRVDLGKVSPQEERVEYIYLYDSMFTWSDGTSPDQPSLLSSKQIRDAKLTVRSSSSKVLESVSINNRESRIEVKFLTGLASTKELDFDFTVTLSVDGKRQNDYSMVFTGTMENQVLEVYVESGPVDISDGTVVEAQEYISKIDLQLEHGVTVTAKIFNGKRCYGVITHTLTADDEAVKAKYPAIDDIFTLKTVGLDSTGNTVRFGGEYSGYHVYDGNLNYLGTTGESLPLSEKYYLAAAKLDIAAEEPAAPVTPMDNELPSSPVDTEYPQNTNDNPTTGR